jgi:hypothetical protein
MEMSWNGAGQEIRGNARGGVQLAGLPGWSARSGVFLIHAESLTSTRGENGTDFRRTLRQKPDAITARVGASCDWKYRSQGSRNKGTREREGGEKFRDQGNKKTRGHRMREMGCVVFSVLIFRGCE